MRSVQRITTAIVYSWLQSNKDKLTVPCSERTVCVTCEILCAKVTYVSNVRLKTYKWFQEQAPRSDFGSYDFPRMRQC